MKTTEEDLVEVIAARFYEASPIAPDDARRRVREGFRLYKEQVRSEVGR